MKKVNDIFETINNIVIEGLTKEGMEWFKPWKSGQDNSPFNLSTKRFYNGFNIFMLNCIMKHEGYKYNQWLTYKQAIEQGGNVIKGSKSSDVYFWQIGYYDNKAKKFVSPKQISSINVSEMLDSHLRYRKTFSVRFYKVFNVAQCEGVEPIKEKEEITSTISNNPNEVAENIVSNYVSKQNGLKITHRGGGAYYAANSDIVNMPSIESFIDADSYYKVLFHELAHSTGHSSRLNRKTLMEFNKWGDVTYAKEELVAEISAMYMVGLLGLNPKDNDTNSQAYIKGWCKHIKDNSQECVYAMQQATKVIDYLQL
jgi:antirestriction protein ArdC